MAGSDGGDESGGGGGVNVMRFAGEFAFTPPPPPPPLSAAATTTSTFFLLLPFPGPPVRCLGEIYRCLFVQLPSRGKCHWHY